MSKTDYIHELYGFIDKFFVRILRGFGSSFLIYLFTPTRFWKPCRCESLIYNSISISICFTTFFHKLAQIHKLCNFATQKKSSEMLLVYSSPGRADILLWSDSGARDKGENGTKRLLEGDCLAPYIKYTYKIAQSTCSFFAKK